MSKYDTNKTVRKYIDKRLKVINETLRPIMSATDCTIEEFKKCLKRENDLKREIKYKDKEAFLLLFEV